MRMWLRYIGGIAALGAVAVAGCGDDAALAPEDDRLTGVYTLSDWLYVIGGDTLEITEDSYVRIQFIDDEHVKGEGFVVLRVPVQQPDGRVVYRRVPILPEIGPRMAPPPDTLPVPLEGWYYLSRADAGMDTLRFRLAKGAGAGTWIESFDWLLGEDWDSYRINNRYINGKWSMVHRRR